MSWHGARVLLYPMSSPLSFTQTPIDISADVKRFGTDRGRDFIFDDFQTGEVQALVLDNSSGQYTADNDGQVTNLLPGNVSRPGRASRDGSAFVGSYPVSWSIALGPATPQVGIAIPASDASGRFLKPASIADYVPVSAATVYSARASAWYSGSGAGSAARVNITWLDSNYGVISTTNGTGAALSTSPGTLTKDNVTSPAGAAFAYVWVDTTATVAGAYTLWATSFGLVQASSSSGCDFPHQLWPWVDAYSVVSIDLGLAAGGWQRIFTGFISNIDTAQDEGSPLLATATVSLLDFAAYLADVTVDSPVGSMLTGTLPQFPLTTLVHVPLNDVGLATTADGTVIAGGAIIQPYGTKGNVAFGSTPAPSEALGTGAHFNPWSSTRGKYLDMPSGVGSTSGGIWSGWVVLDAGLPSTGTTYGIFEVTQALSNVPQTKWQLFVDDTGRMLDLDDGNQSVGLPSSFTLKDGAWHHVAIAWDAAMLDSAGNATPRIYLDGVPHDAAGAVPSWVKWGSQFALPATPGVVFSLGGPGRVMFAHTGTFYGGMCDWSFIQPPAMTTANCDAYVAALYLAGGVSSLGDGQSEIQRLNLIQTLGGMATTTPSPFTEIITMTGVDATQNLLDAALDIGRSSGASVFVNASGVLTMVDRRRRQAGVYGTARAITEAGLQPEGDLTWQRSNADRTNSVVVTSDDNNLRVSVSDPTAVALNGVISDSLDTKSQSQADMLATAQWRLYLRKKMRWRVSSVTFNMTVQSDANHDLLAAWELGSPDWLDFSALLPAQAPPGQACYFVERIQIDVDVDTRTVTWTAELSDAAPWLAVAHSGSRGDLSVIGW